MTMLSIVLAVSAPSLSRFFRGRSLDAEAQRFVGLTRYAQSRAVSEGMPMVLWIDAEQRLYGLLADPSYTEQDTREVQFDLHRNIEVEVEWPASTGDFHRTKSSAQWFAHLPTFRFQPDGFISDLSPELILFREGEEDAVWVGRSRNRLSYEVQTNHSALLHR
jgi:hypothetical protein